ncbi:DMT family transporter [Siminovitchia sp. FSL H7-0308]|uniref:Drug/metabolite transporter (DMT)-like permease n=1 Tax=Siminovitchia thermophila TaxID=1245522 RepID=A0ABS2RG75_9BACI|nr:DMT family transporter [Siminovitchia thermophila]MBM7717586.1 drug/metabolite transporter (DMT)-like permease [Siminovitchia thermophila]
METRRKLNPYIVVMIGVLTISSSAILVKLSSAEAGTIAFYRMFFSVCILLPMFLRRSKSELRMMKRNDWIYSLLAGIFLAFHFILWFESLNYTSVASSTVLVTLQPLFAFIGTFLFFKEKYSIKSITSAAVAMIGGFVISWGDFRLSGAALLGDMLALSACALITAYLLVGQSLRQRISLITYTFLVYSISTIVLFFYVIIRNEPLYPYPIEDWIYFLLLAILPNLLGHSLFNWALKWVSTAVISMAVLFEPVGATILAYLILSEKVAWFQLAGGSIIIISVLLFIMNVRREGGRI